MSEPASPSVLARARGAVRQLVLSVPVPRSLRSRASEAQAYWASHDDEHWASNSHHRESLPGWDDIGRVHLGFFDEFATASGFPQEPGRVLEWGAGGGANAVAFAPRASEFIAVEVSQQSLDECGRQVRAACSTPYVPVLVGVDSPEDALETVAPGVDLFLCLYVIELVPSRAHARRILETAAALLRPGGAAIVQVKYQTASPLTRPRTWGYRRQLAAMTTFPIHTFWELTTETGFTPHYVRLVPRNDLDERYAYYFLTRDA